MIRIIPDMQVGPIGYFLSWFIVAMAAIGIIFAGTGGAIVWVLFWMGVAFVVYLLLRNILGRMM